MRRVAQPEGERHLFQEGRLRQRPRRARGNKPPLVHELVAPRPVGVALQQRRVRPAIRVRLALGQLLAPFAVEAIQGVAHPGARPAMRGVENMRGKAAHAGSFAAPHGLASRPRLIGGGVRA
jgi:hypothetical protein